MLLLAVGLVEVLSELLPPVETVFDCDASFITFAVPTSPVFAVGAVSDPLLAVEMVLELEAPVVSGEEEFAALAVFACP